MAHPHSSRELLARTVRENRGNRVVRGQTAWIETRYSCVCGCKGKLLLGPEGGTTCRAQLDKLEESKQQH